MKIIGIDRLRYFQQVSFSLLALKKSQWKSKMSTFKHTTVFLAIAKTAKQNFRLHEKAICGILQGREE